MNNFFNLWALDKQFNLVSLLSPINVQWRRKWYEPGTFSIQIPIEQWNNTFKYIYSPERPEVGAISQINYLSKNDGKQYIISGYFLENELNKRTCYKNGTTNITNSPTWTGYSGKAEDVAKIYFDSFKKVVYNVNGATITADLPIQSGASLGRGKNSAHERNYELLGKKISQILKPSEMAYRINYDYQNNSMTFVCAKGKDLTQSNTEGNNPVLFSTAYGNLTNPDVLLSYTDYKNAYIAYNDNDNYCLIGDRQSASDDDIIIKPVNARSKRSDYSDEQSYINALNSEGINSLYDSKKKLSVDFSALVGSYEYMKDFDLGDKCSIDIPEIQLSLDSVLIGCTEVIKAGAWSLTMEFDTDNSI